MNFNFQFPVIEQIEKRTKAIEENTIYDVIIIGGGPSALTAAVYCLRKGVKTALITKEFGGQITETATIENYMGYKYIEGNTLAQKFKEQVEQFELSLAYNTVVEKVINDKIKKIYCSDGKVYLSRSIIISTGKRWKTLNVVGEKELVGKGVAYCAICDAPLFKDKTVLVVGGGNSAVEAAIDLCKIAKKVILVQNLEKYTADKILLDKLNEFNNFETLFSHTVSKINGKNFVESVELHDLKNDRIFNIEVQGVFIEIGLIPNSEAFEGVVALNQYKEIIVDCACKTSAEGIFAAGDVTSVPYKQIIIAAGEGAKAALSACEYILSNKKE
ncbi:MAG TPA: FAD-dependent oxidoreductase [Exilispira sp.]|nr:FAD-dependent oxidoreductase [Exilispira sp.]